MFKPRQPLRYSRSEYISDAVVHVSGLTLAMIAAPILVTLTAVWIGDARAVTAVTIYAVSLITMLLCSALYNMIKHAEWSDRLRRLDQSAIYLKIAGTYTPFLMLTSTKAGWILVAIWVMALAGAALIFFARQSFLYLAIALYLGLGWIGVVFWGPALSGLSMPAIALVISAGVTYTIGVLFLIWQRLPHHVTIWHVFVLVASAKAYAAVMIELIRMASVTA
ncbi:MAG: hemolysin III family protein [Pseudomonadota bacterium]